MSAIRVLHTTLTTVKKNQALRVSQQTATSRLTLLEILYSSKA
ncbi:hypothetical protein EVA_13257 [gut metagenome]|uniref:Uncharacterized protein n=1 Tax=gut metagenome TaxID=749906 RepID=J9FVU0_9ZZZZ